MLALIHRVAGRALALVRKLAWAGPLVVRIVVGFAFAHNGWGKLHSLDNVTQFFESLGIPAPGAQAAMVSTIEFAGGILLMLGLGTRIVAALLVGVMTVATLTSALPQAEHVLDLANTIEVTYLVIFLWLVVHGAGAVSVDAAIVRTRHTGGAATRVGVAP